MKILCYSLPQVIKLSLFLLLSNNLFTVLPTHLIDTDTRTSYCHGRSVPTCLIDTEASVAIKSPVQYRVLQKCVFLSSSTTRPETSKCMVCLSFLSPTKTLLLLLLSPSPFCASFPLPLLFLLERRGGRGGGRGERLRSCTIRV